VPLMRPPPLRPFALERYFAEHEFAARYLLGCSDPEAMTMSELLDLEPSSRAQLEQLSLGYTETAGAPALRRAVAALHQRISPEQVLVCCGAEEPIFAFMNVMICPGDHVVAQWPGYQSHYEVARARGAEITPWRGDPERGWSFDVDELASLLRPTTKGLLVSSPHNPTGAHFTPAQWSAVVELARERGLWLFSDEVYRGLEHDPAARLSAACDVYERGVSVNGTSKSYALAGLRIGWLATRAREIYTAVAAFKDYTTISSAAPSELLATIAVQHSAALWQRSRARLLRNVELLDAFFARHRAQFSWRRPSAGTTALVRYRPGGASAFADKTVREHGVMLVPSPHFDCGDEHLRFGYGRANLAEALAAFERALPAPE
jgi:aspartate/methionine/tyrosine aminotransferase